MASPAPTAAQTRWELENGVRAGEPPGLGGGANADAAVSDVDALSTWDKEAAAAVQREKPWARDPHWFQR